MGPHPQLSGKSVSAGGWPRPALHLLGRLVVSAEEAGEALSVSPSPPRPLTAPLTAALRIAAWAGGGIGHVRTCGSRLWVSLKGGRQSRPRRVLEGAQQL